MPRMKSKRRIRCSSKEWTILCEKMITSVLSCYAFFLQFLSTPSSSRETKVKSLVRHLLTVYQGLRKIAVRVRIRVRVPKAQTLGCVGDARGSHRGWTKRPGILATQLDVDHCSIATCLSCSTPTPHPWPIDCLTDLTPCQRAFDKHHHAEDRWPHHAANAHAVTRVVGFALAQPDLDDCRPRSTSKKRGDDDRHRTVASESSSIHTEQTSRLRLLG